MIAARIAHSHLNALEVLEQSGATESCGGPQQVRDLLVRLPPTWTEAPKIITRSENPSDVHLHSGQSRC